MAKTMMEGLKYINSVGTAITGYSVSQDRLQRALISFYQVLTPKELEDVSHKPPNAQSVLNLTSEIDRKGYRRSLRRWGSHLQPFLEAIQLYSSAIDTMVSSNPLVAALVWGGVKFFITAALNFSSSFEKLAELFRIIGRLCPAFKEFQEIFSESIMLRESLSEFYAIVIEFCTEALLFLNKRTFSQFGQSLWAPLQGRLRDFETQLREQREAIDLQIGIASHKLLQQISIYQHAGERHHSDQIKQWAKHHESGLQQQRSQEETMRKALLDKLSNYDHRPCFSKARNERYKDTGLWLFDCPEYRNWDEEDKSCGLWLHGIPGCGKTILIAGAIDHIFSLQSKQKGRTSISYFFCDFNNQKSRQVRTILSSLVKQILSIYKTTTPEIENKLRMIVTNELREPDIGELYDLLECVTRLPATAYFFIDGLDECEDSDRCQVLSLLTKLIQNGQRNMKFIIASRQEIDIAESLKEFYKISLEPSRTSSDIKVFIEDIIDEKLKNGHLIVNDPSMGREIKETLARGSDGMFLWVTFQIEDICRENNDEDIREVLRCLPRGLNETYARILKRINKDRKPDVAKRVFQWLAAARRPLSLDELADAIALSPGCLRWDNRRAPTSNLRMLQNCGNLVICREEDNIVQFVHSTVLEFFLSEQHEVYISKFSIQKSEADRYVGKVCLTYLSLPNFERQLSSITKSHDHTISAADTPVSEWVPAMVESIPEGKLLLNARRFFTSGQSTVTARRFLPQPIPLPVQSPIDILSQEFSLLGYVSQNWIYHCNDISQVDKVYWKLFSDAIFHRVLPFPHVPWGSSGGSPNHSDYTIPLKWAVVNGHVALFNLIVSVLKVTGDSIIPLMTIGTTSFFEIAVRRKDAALVEIMVNLGINIHKHLRVAAGAGDSEMVERLIEFGANDNADPASSDGRTALQAAAGGGHLAVVDRLIESGAGVNAKPAGNDGRTALQVAAGGGHLAVVDRLIESGADVNANPADLGGRTALQAAAGGGHLTVLDRLLESGAKVNADPASNHGRTALQAAAGGGHLAVLDRLIESGVDVNAKPAHWSGRTALQAAAGGGHLTVVDRLLESGADVNADPASNHGRTALQAAAGGGHLAVIDRLLESGADANAYPAYRAGPTTLQAALDRGHKGVAERLRKAGAKL